MLRVGGLSHVPEALKGAAVALGAFDGLHLGHQAVLAAARAGAGTAPLVLVAFEPPPRAYFAGPGSPALRLMTPDLRAEAAEACGVDGLVELAFNADLAAQPPLDFARELLSGLAPRHLAVGHDFRFGAARGGDCALLEGLCTAAGSGFTQVMPVAGADGERISSTRIREALKAGRIDVVSSMLGRPWRIEGVVDHGEKRGRTIGWPTANLRLGPLLEPRHGIYAIRVLLDDGSVHCGVANFGRTPTTGLRDPLLEAHLFDFASDLYGKRLRIDFIAFQRPEAHFDSLDALVAQIAADAVEARRILAASVAG
jgi:riboflavin kinase / FMN adenylyltransferase